MYQFLTASLPFIARYQNPTRLHALLFLGLRDLILRTSYFFCIEFYQLLTSNMHWLVKILLGGVMFPFVAASFCVGLVIKLYDAITQILVYGLFHVLPHGQERKEYIDDYESKLCQINLTPENLKNKLFSPNCPHDKLEKKTWVCLLGNICRNGSADDLLVVLNHPSCPKLQSIPKFYNQMLVRAASDSKESGTVDQLLLHEKFPEPHMKDFITALSALVQNGRWRAIDRLFNQIEADLKRLDYSIGLKFENTCELVQLMINIKKANRQDIYNRLLRLQKCEPQSNQWVDLINYAIERGYLGLADDVYRRLDSRIRVSKNHLYRWFEAAVNARNMEFFHALLVRFQLGSLNFCHPWIAMAYYGGDDKFVENPGDKERCREMRKCISAKAELPFTANVKLEALEKAACWGRGQAFRALLADTSINLLFCKGLLIKAVQYGRLNILYILFDFLIKNKESALKKLVCCEAIEHACQVGQNQALIALCQFASVNNILSNDEIIRLNPEIGDMIAVNYRDNVRFAWNLSQNGLPTEQGSLRLPTSVIAHIYKFSDPTQRGQDAVDRVAVVAKARAPVNTIHLRAKL